MNPKNRKYKDEAYLREQRDARCLGCGAHDGCDPHHIFHSGGKHGNDLMAVPLCRSCHSGLHAFKDSEESWWEMRGYDIWYVIVNKLMDRIENERD